MTGKEAIESLRQEYFLENGERIIIFKADDERLEIIEKDLEEYEELKKIMGTPIQEIMKNLKEIEIIKKWFIDRIGDYTWEKHRNFFIDCFIHEDEEEEKPMFDILLKWTKE